MRRPKLAPWILVGTLTLTSAAKAGCCDDFWSCMAAVATAGVSCQIQGMIDIVKALSETVNTLFNDLKDRSGEIIEDAKATVERSLDDMKQSRQRAVAELSSAASMTRSTSAPPTKLSIAPKVASQRLDRTEASSSRPEAMVASSKLANVQAAATQPAPAPADPAAMRAALKEADTYVQELKTKGTALSEEVSTAEKRAREAVLRHVVVAHRIALDVGLQPLRMLRDSLLDLLSHPERLFDPSAQVEADLRRIGSEIPALLDRIGREVTEESKNLLEQASPQTKQLEDQAEVAKAVADATRRLAANQSQADLDALNRLLPNKTTQKVTGLRGVTLPVGIAARHELLTSAVSRLDVAKLPLVAKHKSTVNTIVTDWDRFRKQAKAAASIDAATKQKANAQLAQHFRGKSKVQADDKRRELIEEARRRFAKDPKTLEKVERYLANYNG